MAHDENSSVKLAFNSGYFMCGSDVFYLPLPGTEKLIYMALTRYAGSNNRAWPSYEKLAIDASCSSRRAIYAVNRLCSCRLVVKEKRGNRTNVYMVFPPKYYCEKSDENDSSKLKKGAEAAPQNNVVTKVYQNEGDLSAPPKEPRVQNLHAESATGAPSGCSDCTVSVKELHPNINKNNNKNIITNKEVESEHNSNTNPGEVEDIIKAFKEKRSTVRDIVIDELLKEYPVKDIKAAIKCTDFEQARNPIAVIKYMLKEGTYVMPVEREELYVEKAEVSSEPPVVDDEEVRKLLKETKAALSF